MDCYEYPQYWDLAFRDSTREEADFVDALAEKYSPQRPLKIYEPGCGGGRLVVELSRRGYDVTGIDLSQSSIKYLKRRLRRNGLQADVRVANMIDFRCEPPVDIAINTVNTFRHLTTEADAARHLESVAGSLKRGGFYVIGFHLLPPDAALEDQEVWEARHGKISVHMTLDAFGASRKTRLETLRFKMQVRGGKSVKEFTTDYSMRIYTAKQVKSLFAKVPALELIDVFDFYYDLEDPLLLDNQLGDAVFLLRKQ